MDNAPTFNSGIAFVEQISKLLWTCNMASINNDYILWYKTLKILFNNTSYFLNKEDREEIKEIFTKVKVPDRERFKTKKEIIEYLSSSEGLYIIDEILRFKLHEKGLIMPKGQDPRTAMMN